MALGMTRAPALLARLCEAGRLLALDGDTVWPWLPREVTEPKPSCQGPEFLACRAGWGGPGPAACLLTCCRLRPDMADLTVPEGSIIMECCLTLGGRRAMLTPYGTGIGFFLRSLQQKQETPQAMIIMRQTLTAPTMRRSFRLI